MPYDATPYDNTMFDQDDHDRELPPNAVLRTGGPRSVHHLLLALSPENPVYLYADPADAGAAIYFQEAREVWQSMPGEDGLRWRWFVAAQGRIVEAAPGNVHGLRSATPVALTVTWYTLPDRDSVGRVRQALRVMGATCARGQAA
ncbi:hypothetical protein [Azospirillum sp. sgz302134]